MTGRPASTSRRRSVVQQETQQPSCVLIGCLDEVRVTDSVVAALVWPRRPDTVRTGTQRRSAEWRRAPEVVQADTLQAEPLT